MKIIIINANDIAFKGKSPFQILLSITMKAICDNIKQSEKFKKPLHSDLTKIFIMRYWQESLQHISTCYGNEAQFYDDNNRYMAWAVPDWFDVKAITSQISKQLMLSCLICAVQCPKEFEQQLIKHFEE